MISRFTYICGNDTSRGKRIWRQSDRPATACIDFNCNQSPQTSQHMHKARRRMAVQVTFSPLSSPRSPFFGSSKMIYFPLFPARHLSSTMRWCSNQLWLIFFIPSQRHS
jgi:hypothetical protein